MAQQDFRPGYIVTSASDTLRGEVDYRGDIALSELCRYRNGSEQPREFEPEDIRAYGFADGRSFVSEVWTESRCFSNA